jgi:hypothetical protein
MRAAWRSLVLSGLAFVITGCGVDGGSRGRAGDAGSGADADAGATDDGGVDECEGVDFPVSGHPPRALIALDRSASMQNGIIVTPWEACSEAIVTISAALDDRIDFGLLLFPGLDETCAPPADTPEVPVAPGAGPAVEAELDSDGPDGNGTPIAAALKIAFEHLVGLEGEGARLVVLATDGAPNCSDNPMYSCDTCVSTATICASPRACLDDVGTYSVVTEYHDNWGIDTYVIGLGGVEEDWDEVLSNVAAYGGTGEYYPADAEGGADDVVATLQEIAAENVECVFDVDWSSLGAGVSQDPDLVNVLVDGAPVPYSADCANAAGWRWADADTIELCPSLCEDYKWGVVSAVHASFGCDTVVE